MVTIIGRFLYVGQIDKLDLAASRRGQCVLSAVHFVTALTRSVSLLRSNSSNWNWLNYFQQSISLTK